MDYSHRILLITVLVLALVLGACARDGDTSTTGEKEGTELGLDETHDAVRSGARLVLNYDRKRNAFNGFVENTTGETQKQVRVEVHLSNGTELGPTTPADLSPGERLEISLQAGGKGLWPVDRSPRGRRGQRRRARTRRG